MPKVFGYGRHSTSKQGMTRQVQEAKCKDYYDTHLAKEGYEWGEFFYDSATSGDKQFAEREQGRVLFFTAQRGDYILIAAMDRIFRNAKDGFHVLELLESRGIKHILLDMPLIDFTRMPRAYAEYMQGNLLLSAQLMRRLVSQRMIEDNEVKRANGIPFSRSAPIGWRIVGERKDKAYRVDQREREMVAFMQTLHDDGMSVEEIANWNYIQRQFDCKRRFLTPARVRWALRSRQAGYPKVTNIEEFNRKLRSGEIVLGTA